MQTRNDIFFALLRIIICFSVSCVVFMSCKTSSQKKKNNNTSTKLPYEVAYIKQGTCVGKCPVYEASFWSDGRMIYNGIDYLPVKGQHTYVVPEKMAQNIVVEAKKIKIRQFKDEYKSVESTQQITTLRVVVEGKMKQIVIQAKSDAPPELLKFKQKMHEEVIAITEEQPPFK